MKLIDPNKTYYKGNTHTHTTRSDGVLSPEEVLRLYKDHGYDFIVLSDHWKANATRRFEDMLVMTGVEYDFTFAHQVLHVVGVFPDEAATEGFHRKMDHTDVIARINRAGGAAIAAHPAWSLNTPDFLMSLEGICATEIYNSLSGSPWNAPRADSSAILDVTAAAGCCIPQLAADDSHFYEGEQCRSFTMLQADELTPEGVIAALKRGSFYASQGPRILDAEIADGRFILHTTPVRRCCFISDMVYVNDRCRVGEGMTENIYTIRPNEHFIRVEIEDDQGRRAWLSPVKL